MSIQIDKNKCIGCQKCSAICPGSLISMDEQKKAFMAYPKDCWGCTACLKECSVGAIKFFLGADLGGRGGYLFTENNEECIVWHIRDSEGKERILKTKKDQSNNY